METGTVKLPKALINMSRLMMPMFIDVRGRFVSCQDLGDAIREFRLLCRGTWPSACAQPGFPLRIGRSTVAQKIRKFSGMYLHVFQTYMYNMRALSPFLAQKFPIFLNLDRGGRGEWDISKSIPNQISQIIVYENHLCQVKIEHKKMDLQWFPGWGGAALSESWKGRRRGWVVAGSNLY